MWKSRSDNTLHHVKIKNPEYEYKFILFLHPNPNNLKHHYKYMQTNSFGILQFKHASVELKKTISVPMRSKTALVIVRDFKICHMLKYKIIAFRDVVQQLGARLQQVLK